ncbi:MAG TPA: hypothetical protein ACFYD3_11830 [Candidatus Hypogeohydataceae bacterium YC41]
MRTSLSIKILCLYISCLLVVGNLCNVPMLSMANKKSYPCEGHGCGCKNAEDCRRQCCCRSHASTKDEVHVHAIVGAQSASGGCPLQKYSFLRSLTCMGYPHKFFTSSILVFLPQEAYVIPAETPLGFTRESPFPAPLEGYIPPIEKPPRPLARVI